MIQDPYQILGISKSATQDDIKKAYRKLAKKFHPDLNPGNQEAEKKFKETSEAYDMLETAEKREKYDQGELDQAQNFSGRRQGPFYYETQQDGGRYTYSTGNFENMGDIFESLFKGKSSSEMHFRGEDQFYQMDVDFQDMVLGAEREITLPGGKKLKVRIPPGIETGKKLRFTGQGGTGMGKGSPGDVYVEVRVNPSPVFRRIGNDLEMDLSVSLNEAVLGGDVQINMIDQPITLKIPPGVNTGSRLRVKEKGVMDTARQKRGNLYVVLKVVLPTTIDEELKESVRKWSQTHAYNPRKD
ncbi:MAG: DnaJ domain-containing protein [SAR324 cluster bacterium]|nr:DnaJ domain-containing protein [SAR324 cluster bacterium]